MTGPFGQAAAAKVLAGRSLDQDRDKGADRATVESRPGSADNLAHRGRRHIRELDEQTVGESLDEQTLLVQWQVTSGENGNLLG